MSVLWLSGIKLGSEHSWAAPWAVSLHFGEDKTVSARVKHLHSKPFRRGRDQEKKHNYWHYYLLIICKLVLFMKVVGNHGNGNKIFKKVEWDRFGISEYYFPPESRDQWFVFSLQRLLYYVGSTISWSALEFSEESTTSQMTSQTLRPTPTCCTRCDWTWQLRYYH